MRTRNEISFVLMLLVVSCKGSYKKESLLRYHQGFDRVFALKDEYPDNALSLFNSITDTIEFVRFYRENPQQYYDYQVLYAELNYKNNKDVDNGDLVLEAARYYDSVLTVRRPWRSHPDMAFMCARADCFAGYVECERGMPVEAMEHFISALRIMDGLNGEAELLTHRDENPEYLHFTALIYNRIGWLFYVNDLWDEAIRSLDMANEYFQREGNMKGIFSNYSVLGEIMMTRGDQQAAKEYFRIADSLKAVWDFQLSIRNWDCELNDALVKYENGMKRDAYDLVYRILSQNEDLSVVKQLHFHLGRFYFEDHEYDSALLYLGNGLQEFTYQTISSLDMIVRIYDSLGLYEEAAYYNSCLTHVFFGRMDQMRSDSMQSSLFDSYLTGRKDYRKKGFFILGLVLVALLFVFQLIFALFNIKRREKRHGYDMQAFEKQRLSLEHKIEKAQTLSLQQEEKIKSLEAELIRVIARRDVGSMSFEDRIEVLAETPIGRRVRMVSEANVKAGVSYPELVLSRNQMMQLVHAVDTVFPKFSSRIIETYPRLKYPDVVYCCMYILGITEVQAAALTGKTYQAVWMRSGKLREIFGSKSDLQIVLFEIMKKMYLDGNDVSF